MCTTVVSIDPRSPVPVLLIGVRDEFLDRPWLGPGRHWPQRPALVGGLDRQAGGTWLAANTELPRVACVLNGRGRMAVEATRLSRGELPLLLAADGELGDLDAARYDPFHLLSATPDSVRLWSWNGEKLTERTLEPGLHLIVNSGLEGADSDDGPGADEMHARVAHFRPLLERARRPEPKPGLALELGLGLGLGAESTATAWGEWSPVADGGGIDPADPRALLVRGSRQDQDWGTSSVSLLALGRDGVRYDFSDRPGDPAAWSTIPTLKSVA
jgi:Transport and Golgi organisation 2